MSEAADIVRSLGFAASHVVLIGGLVPGLLVPVLDPGIEPHVGTADIDLCSSVALIEGDTATYDRTEAVLRRLGFSESGASFRWRRSSGVPVTVEFFCPAKEKPSRRHSLAPPPGTSPKTPTTSYGWSRVGRVGRQPPQPRSRPALSTVLSRSAPPSTASLEPSGASSTSAHAPTPGSSPSSPADEPGLERRAVGAIAEFLNSLPR